MDPFHHLNSSFSSPYHPLLSPSPPHHHFAPPLPPPPLALPHGPGPADPPPPQLLQSPGPAAADRERLPQWSHAETAAFLAVRADLDHAFLTTKRNKALWEAVSARLHAQGFARTPDQCKSKWKNLVTRFKGTEAAAAAAAASAAHPVVDPAAAAAHPAADPAAAQQQQASRQFPFHDEMRSIFDARLQRAAHALESKRAKGKDVRGEDDEGEDDDGDDDEELEAAEDEAGGSAPPEARGGAHRKRRRKQQQATTKPPDQGEVEAMLREFMRRQAEMEERWIEAAEAREAERRAREEEWRTAMVALGEERLALVRRWREREDAWRARAEEREERRHQLVAALLAKLGGDSS